MLKVATQIPLPVGDSDFVVFFSVGGSVLLLSGRAKPRRLIPLRPYEIIIYENILLGGVGSRVGALCSAVVVRGAGAQLRPAKEMKSLLYLVPISTKRPTSLDFVAANSNHWRRSRDGPKTQFLTQGHSGEFTDVPHRRHDFCHYSVTVRYRVAAEHVRKGLMTMAPNALALPSRLRLPRVRRSGPTSPGQCFFRWICKNWTGRGRRFSASIFLHACVQYARIQSPHRMQ